MKRRTVQPGHAPGCVVKQPHFEDASCEIDSAQLPVCPNCGEPGTHQRDEWGICLVDSAQSQATAENVFAYSTGLVCCSVCAPSSLTREQVEQAVNLRYPTGISSRWTISTDPTFHQGGPQPGPCDQSPDDRTHYLMEC